MERTTLQKVIIVIIPFIAILFFFGYQRWDTTIDNEATESEESTNDEDAEANDNETREDIDELETVIISESTSEDTRAVQTGDALRVHYRGWLASNGSVFDESYSRGADGFSFMVGQGVIEGWSEGVVGMRLGEVRRLYIPSEKGYGEAGAGANIPPNSDLIFDVELLEFTN